MPDLPLCAQHTPIKIVAHDIYMLQTPCPPFINGRPDSSGMEIQTMHNSTSSRIIKILIVAIPTGTVEGRKRNYWCKTSCCLYGNITAKKAVIYHNTSSLLWTFFHNFTIETSTSNLARLCLFSPFFGRLLFLLLQLWLCYCKWKTL